MMIAKKNILVRICSGTVSSFLTWNIITFENQLFQMSMNIIMYAFFVLGWLTHAALQIAKKTEDLSAFYMEQPCQTYEECLTVRKHTNLPFVIDESVTDLQSLVKG